MIDAKHISTTEAKDQLSTLVNRAAFGRERIFLTRRGKDVAVLVPIEDVTYIEEMEKSFLAKEVHAGLTEFEQGKSKPWEEVKAELGL
ncbi:MAG: type II toxin-antitoxin system Phd/YefM family antitoxin [bacterium]|nr:type II toxin-antitoxin system Phd/YefM family antitoxin [bacterium]